MTERNQYPVKLDVHGVPVHPNTYGTVTCGCCGHRVCLKRGCEVRFPCGCKARRERWECHQCHRCEKHCGCRSPLGMTSEAQTKAILLRHKGAAGVMELGGHMTAVRGKWSDVKREW